MNRAGVLETEAMKPPIKITAPTTGTTGLVCPSCGEAAAPPASAGSKSPRPFCSTRCAEVDLGRWFQGHYFVPVVDATDDTIVDAMIAGAKAAKGQRED